MQRAQLSAQKSVSSVTAGPAGLGRVMPGLSTTGTTSRAENWVRRQVFQAQ